MLDHLGLLVLDDETLTAVLRVASRLVQEGHVSWCDPAPQTHAEVQAEIARLMADNVTLVLVREPEAPDAARHAAAVDPGEGETTTLTGFVPKPCHNQATAHPEPGA
jgi:hypothetical protein